MSRVSPAWYLLGLLSCAWPLAAQQRVASETPQQWLADAKANKQAQQAAEQAAEAEAPPRARGAGPRAEGGPPPGGRGGPPPGGEQGPPEGGRGRGPGGRGRHGGGEGRAGGGSPAQLLRPEMDFAAPLKDTLILYRSRDAVVFGRRESPAVVILPLAGTPVVVAPGVQAALHEDAQGLRVEVTTSNDIRVTYRYATDPQGVLHVAVRAEGPVPRPGSHFEVERVYRPSGG